MVSSSNTSNLPESEIQKSLALLACYTGSISFQMEPIFPALEGDEANTRRLDLLYLSPDGKLAVGIEVKKDRISVDDMLSICVRKAYPEVLKRAYPDRDITLVITNKLAAGISEKALYFMEHFYMEGVDIKYVPVESIGESLFQEYVDNRLPTSSWIDKRVRKEYSICLSH